MLATQDSHTAVSLNTGWRGASSTTSPLGHPASHRRMELSPARYGSSAGGQDLRSLSRLSRHEASPLSCRAEWSPPAGLARCAPEATVPYGDTSHLSASVLSRVTGVVLFCPVLRPMVVRRYVYVPPMPRWSNVVMVTLTARRTGPSRKASPSPDSALRAVKAPGTFERSTCSPASGRGAPLGRGYGAATVPRVRRVHGTWHFSRAPTHGQQHPPLLVL